ncbi:hypothetical protein EU520_00745 [Candidatus Thorarchaeota archaeon]|nr:MAG: hypothetical protein EU520_00745 [Candidatus Thorarchaeota archaeon]
MVVESTLHYESRDGSGEEGALSEDTRELNLSHRRISEIDLRPLAKCPNLEVLDLSNNLLTQIDLWPLMKCKKLRQLRLRHNRLRRIDVTPLLDCPDLRTIDIDDTVEIVANYDMRAKKLRGLSLEELRGKHPLRWRFDSETMDPLIEVERVRNKLFTELNEIYCSPDNQQILHAELMCRLEAALEDALMREMARAERAEDYKRLYVLERGLEYIRQNAPVAR